MSSYSSEPTVEALVTATRRLGVLVDEPKLLGHGANLVVHLAPSPIVARVATLTAEMRGRPAAYLQRERDLSRALASQGANVVVPTDLVDPGPHVLDQQVFLLLEHQPLVPVDLESADEAESVGRSLSELILMLSETSISTDSTDSTDDGHRWDEISRLISTVTPTTEASAMGHIVSVIDELRDTEPQQRWQHVHGDAHRTNVAMGTAGVMWFDFEDTNRRPLEWDLATLRRSWQAAGDMACKLLDVDPVGPSMRWHHELREVYALLWNLLYAQRFERAREPTAERLRGWLTDHRSTPSA